MQVETGAWFDGGAALAGAAPALAMLSFEMLANCMRGEGTEQNFCQAATQNFSAGLIFAAVAGELFPRIHVHGVAEFASVATGGIVALLLCYSMRDDDEEDGEDSQLGASEELPEGVVLFDKDELGSRVTALNESISKLKSSLPAETAQDTGDRDRIGSTLVGVDEFDAAVHSCSTEIDSVRRFLRGGVAKAELGPMRGHVASLVQQAEHLREHVKDTEADPAVSRDIDEHLKDMAKELDHLHTKHVENPARLQFRRWRPQVTNDHEQHGGVLPSSSSLVFTVTVDAAVDGFLIGIAYEAAHEAGAIMAAATSIEMAFLGLTFALTLSASSHVARAAVLSLPPVVLFSATILGSLLGKSLEGQPLLFNACVSFGATALLFLVTQELLVEAREFTGTEAQTRGVNLCLFGGVLGYFLLQTGSVWLEGCAAATLVVTAVMAICCRKCRQGEAADDHFTALDA